MEGGAVDVGHPELAVHDHQAVLDAAQDGLALLLLGHELVHVETVEGLQAVGHGVELPGQLVQLGVAGGRHLDLVLSFADAPGGEHQLPQRTDQAPGEQDAEGQAGDQGQGAYGGGVPDGALGNGIGLLAGPVHGLLVDLAQAESGLAQGLERGEQGLAVVGRCLRGVQAHQPGKGFQAP